MKTFLILAALSALAVARPDTYKEQEDFQYSRSSSDEGTKSGYYGAQRGNMGGNYERAHNMDSLAQNQMSGLVRQIEGELGDGAKTRTGSVYSAANSRGTYGLGSFDLSNLSGRNFQEGTYFDNSQLQSSLTRASLARNRAGHTNAHSQSYGEYQRVGQEQASDLQSLDNSHGSNQYAYGSSDQSSSYKSQQGFQERNQYDHANTNSHSGYGSNLYTRLISAPVRVIVRPGGTVAVPMAAQTFDAMRGSSLFNQNALTSEAEVLADNHQDSIYKPKHYESSYSYNKKWEKHDTIPTVSVVVPTESPIPTNSELYEDIESHASGNKYNTRGDSQSSRSSSASSRYNANSLSGQSQYQSNYNSQTGSGSGFNRGESSDSSNTYARAQQNAARYQGTSASSSLNSHAGYNAGSQLDLNSQVEDLDTKPKSYQSSYSYHKSWERQGDPYVIKPASNGYYDSQASQRLTSATKNLGYAGYQSGSQYSQDQADCDENGHTRRARSYYTDNQAMQQQNQNINYDGQEQIQQDNWQNIEDLGQQTQNNWDQQNLSQQSHNQWDKLEDLGQQSQSNWALDNVGQQSQTQWDKLEDLGQQSQSNWAQENVGQQSQTQWDKLEDLGQQSQNNWAQENVGQQSQHQWDQLETLSRQSQDHRSQQNAEQQTQTQWDKLEDLGQHSQNNWAQQNVDQQSTHSLPSWGKLEDIEKQPMEHKAWDKLEDIRQDTQSITYGQQVQNFLGQHNQDVANVLEYKPQDDKQHNKPNMDSEYSQSINEKENGYNNHHVEKQWNTFDTTTSNKYKITIEQTQDNNKSKTESDQFYWHQISNNEGINQQSRKESFTPVDFLPHQEEQADKGNKPVWEDTNDSIGQSFSNVAFDHPSADYGYSSGFVNPSVFNQYNRNQFPRYQNTYSRDGDDGNRNWNSHLNSNRHSQVNWHEHATNTDNFSQVNNFHSNSQGGSLTDFWAKFDNIETESGLSTTHNFTSTALHSIQNQTNSNSSLVDSSQSHMTFLTGYQSPKESLASNNDQNKLQQELPKIYEDLASDKYRPKDTQSTSSEELETPLDIGRGDVGPEDLSSKIDISNKPYKNLAHLPSMSQDTDNKFTELDNETPEFIANSKHVEKELPDEQLSVLSLQNQKTLNVEDQVIVSNVSNKTRTLENNGKHRFVYKQKPNKHDNNTELHAIDYEQMDAENDTEHLEQQSETLSQTNVIDGEIEKSQQHLDRHLHGMPNYEQESVNLEQQNSYNFDQEFLQDFKNHNENQEQHNLHEFTLNLEYQNKNLEQQNLHDFAQENVPENFQQENQNSFGQINETQEHVELTNTQNNSEALEQRNMSKEQQIQLQIQNNFREQHHLNHVQQNNQDLKQHDINASQEKSSYMESKTEIYEWQKSENINQQDSLHVQDNLDELRLQNESVQQPNLSHAQNNTQHYRQGLQLTDKIEQVYGQHNEYLEQQSINNFDINDEQDFGQHNEQLKSQVLHNYELENGQNLGQDEQLEQENLDDFGQQGEEQTEQENLSDFGQQNLQDLGQLDKLNTQQYPINNLQMQTYSRTIVEPVNEMQYQNYNPQSGPTNKLEHPKIESPPVPVTEKPGFWKSVGNKISSAKDKVVSWFKS